MFYIIAVYFAVFGDHKLLAYSNLSIKGTKEEMSRLNIMYVAANTLHEA